MRSVAEELGDKYLGRGQSIPDIEMDYFGFDVPDEVTEAQEIDSLVSTVELIEVSGT